MAIRTIHERSASLRHRVLRVVSGDIDPEPGDRPYAHVDVVGEYRTTAAAEAAQHKAIDKGRRGTVAIQHGVLIWAPPDEVEALLLRLQSEGFHLE